MRGLFAEAVVEKDRDTVFSAAGAASSGHAEQGDPNVTMCMICMEDLNSDEDKLTMSCGHTFCKDCWLGHFQVIINEGRANNMTCMEFKCGAICSQPYDPCKPLKSCLFLGLLPRSMPGLPA